MIALDRKQTKNRSFTLIELLVVIAIIGLLAALAMFTVPSILASSRDTRRISDLRTFPNALELYYQDNGKYPIWSTGGCTTDGQSNPLISALVPTYMTTLPKDPKLTQYCLFYQSDSTGANYKLAAKMEQNTTKTANDGGTASNYYEVYNASGSTIPLTNSNLDKIMTNQQRYGDTSIIGDWKFEEGSGTVTADSSAVGNDGTLCQLGTCPLQGPTWQTPANCISGNCLSFDGNDYVHINPANPTEYVTLTGWFKRQGVPESGYHILFMQGTQIENSIYDSGSQTRTGVTTSTMGRRVFDSGSGVCDGNWHFLAFTYSGSKLTAYVDASQTTQQNVSGALTTGFDTNIGYYGYYAGSYYTNGFQDEIRIYNRALSTCEICEKCRTYWTKAQCSSCTNCSGN